MCARPSLMSVAVGGSTKIWVDGWWPKTPPHLLQQTTHFGECIGKTPRAKCAREIFNSVPKPPLGGIFPLQISAHNESLNEGGLVLGLGGWDPLSPSASGGLLCTFFFLSCRPTCIVFFYGPSRLYTGGALDFSKNSRRHRSFSRWLCTNILCVCVRVQGRGGFTLVWRGQRGSTRGVTKVHLCSSYNYNV